LWERHFQQRNVSNSHNKNNHSQRLLLLIQGDDMTEELEIDEIQTEDQEILITGEKKNPALTIVIQSWATPIIGIVLLAVGLLGGYFGRPLISPETEPVVSVTGQESKTGNVPAVTVPTPDVDLAAQQQELMRVVSDGTRHFRGDPNAPVTIIEFSDFM
jgi:hypothetical protein